MGDRGNIFVTANEDTLEAETGIYLYTHWGGSRLKETLKRALSRHQRWDDEAYLTRIIFCEMVKGHESAETGFGISLEIQDNDNEIVSVLTELQMVKIGGSSWSFKNFIELDLE
jgi:hypothetical protein